jgi:hypothetical protein
VPPNPAGVTPGAKSLCVDVNAALTANGLVNQKLEGISVLRVAGRSVLAAVDDNDFNLAHITDPCVAAHERRLRAAAGGLLVGP